MKASNVCKNRGLFFAPGFQNVLCERGGIEILLLLVCIVGVVAFFSLALAFTSLLLEPDIYKKTVEKLEVRKSERLEKGDKLRRLKEELRELASRGSKKEATQKPHQEKLDSRARELKWEHEELLDHYHALLERVEAVHELLKRMPQQTDPHFRKNKENELSRLAKRAQEIDEAIVSRNEAIGSIDSLNELNARLKNFKKTRMALESEVSGLEVKTQYRSTSSHKKPLHIECRANDYVLHPGGDTLSIQDVEQGKHLHKKVAGHDLIAFWIRPEGIAAFRKAYTKAKEIDVAISFEPVQEGVTLESVLGSLTDER